ncbi:MAG TPA: phytanoyl-CoA dioxygenase family protein [Candidatus Methylacidiphilales bacterium]|nr:phytanoyl-CoA dioxygenase family protein [Candidatus Methylacidiphilales bacterium]
MNTTLAPELLPQTGLAAITALDAAAAPSLSVIPRTAGEAMDTSASAYGELRRTSAALALHDPGELRRRMAEDGYLYIPGFFNRADVLRVRDDMLSRLAAAGALDAAFPSGPGDAKASATAVHVPRSAILSGESPLPSLVFSDQLLALYSRLLATAENPQPAIRHYDHIWLRLVRPGKGTLPHCDLPYMGRGTHNVFTAWIPYRDTSLKLGGLIILEKSHLQSHRIRAYLESDVDTYCVNRGPYKHKHGLLSSNPATLREHFGGRWLTTEFRAGDLLTFGMSLIHASLDNQTDEYRLSTDTRYQLAAEPIDERWVGPATEEYAEKNRIGKVC